MPSVLNVGMYMAFQAIEKKQASRKTQTPTTNFKTYIKKGERL